ncbi:MAG: META domain-containing protein [Hyphomonadaceae bacterium]
MRSVLISACAMLALTACAQEQPNELTGRWEVQQIAGASLGEGVDIWIEFDSSGEAVSGFTGCNTFTTTASLFQTSIALAPPAEAVGACASEAAATDEARFLGVLPAVQRYILRGNSLELLQAPSGSETLLRLRRVQAAAG